MEDRRYRDQPQPDGGAQGSMILLGPWGGEGFPHRGAGSIAVSTQEIALRHDFVLGDLPDGLVLVHHPRMLRF